jgi:2,3-bisphosphoglycerate-dependent phosphoglycerate mutase
MLGCFEIIRKRGLKMSKLILMRHGESQWNSSNIFTGWVDIPLSSAGIIESLEAGKQIRSEPIDIIFTSTLCRAQMTVFLAMTVHDSKKVPVVMHSREEKMEAWAKIYSAKTESLTIPVIYAWELNERMYGRLQGVNKQELKEEYGEEQVQIWRRSFDVPPPEGESLEMTAARTIPFFKEKIVSCLEKGQNVFVVAHGNSLRSIIMNIESLSREEIVKLEIPTGIPIIYDYNNHNFKKQL